MSTLNKIPKTGTYGTAVDAMNENFTLIQQSLAEGYSPYQTWIDQGNEGTEQDFLDSLKGADGKDGVVLDPTATTIFDALDDLDGKSESEKEKMIPDGNVVTEIVNKIGESGEEGTPVTEVDLTHHFVLMQSNTIAAVDGVSVPWGVGGTNANRSGAAIPCKEGDRFLISSTRSGSTDRQIAFVDKDNVTLAAYTRSTAYVDYEVTAPAGTAMLLVNTNGITAGKIVKVFEKPTIYKPVATEYVPEDYVAPYVYDGANTRNGDASKSKTGIITHSEGDAASVKTDNIWLPKGTRIEVNVVDQNVKIVGIDYPIYTSDANVRTWTSNVKCTMREDGILCFVFTNKDGSELTPQDLTSSVTVYRPREATASDYNEDKLAALDAMVDHPTSPADHIAEPTLPAFVWVTDVHSSWRQLERALDYADAHDEIQGTFFTGDSIYSDNFNSTNRTQLALPFDDMIKRHTKPLLRVSGNHDQGLTRAEYMASWFRDEIVAKTGEVHPTGCPWWYKDIPLTFRHYEKSGTSMKNVTYTKTLRVIGVWDQDNGDSAAGWYNTSDEQYQWLCERLGEVTDQFVVILRHYPICALNENTMITDWKPVRRYWPVSDSDSPGKFAVLVNAWMTGVAYADGNVSYDFSAGGAKASQFMCYLTGHFHKDFILQHPTYPQVDLSATCTAVISSRHYNRGDLPIATDGKLQDAFNVVAFNWLNRDVRLLRIGADLTTDLRERKMITIELP